MIDFHFRGAELAQQNYFTRRNCGKVASRHEILEHSLNQHLDLSSGFRKPTRNNAMRSPITCTLPPVTATPV